MQAFDPIRARFPQFPILYQQLWRQGGRIAELLNRSVNRDQVAQREDLFGPETDITRIAFDQLLEDLKRFGVRIDRGSGCSAFVVGWVTGQLALLRFRCCLGYRAARAAPLLLLVGSPGSSRCSAFVVGWVTGQLALLRFCCWLGHRAARAAPLLLLLGLPGSSRCSAFVDRVG